jgi:hypothetical protein
MGSKLLSVSKGIDWSFARERQPIDFYRLPEGGDATIC